MPTIETPPGHSSYRLELLGGRHVAVGSCGWRSVTCSTAGLAGAMWDDHIAREASR